MATPSTKAYEEAQAVIAAADKIVTDSYVTALENLRGALDTALEEMQKAADKYPGDNQKFSSLRAQVANHHQQVGSWRQQTEFMLTNTNQLRGSLTPTVMPGTPLPVLPPVA